MGGGNLSKSKFLFIIIIFSALLAGTVSAQTRQIYFKFAIGSKSELGTLTKIISIDNIKGDTVYAYSTSDTFSRFEALGYEYTILPNPGSTITPEMGRTIDDIMQWDTYPTYSAYVAMMNQFATDYPNLCRIENIGTSVNGHALLFAKISTNVDTEENEPEVMYSSSMHGDELVGYVLSLRLIDYLLSNYGTDPQVTSLVDNMEIWINPLANPDGAYYSGDNSVNGSIRYNANWVDLNRNFPDPQDGAHPDGHSYQPETLAMMDFFDQHSFTLSANFHGGVEVVNYPWDTWPRLHADDSWFVQISREYADSAQANSPSGYMNDLDNGITNGWAWYEVDGGRQDYITYFKGGREVTIELSSNKLPSGSQLPNYWNYNHAAMLTYLEQAYYGIRGTVTDFNTGLPVAATVLTLNHDADNSQIYTDPDVGDFHRMIDAGTYDLQFTAAGYTPQTITGVSVGDYSNTFVDVELMPNLDPVPTLSQWGLILLGLLLIAISTVILIREKENLVRANFHTDELN